MHIAYLISHLGQTGVNNVVLDLVKQMTKHGHRCTVFYFTDRLEEMTYPCEVVKLRGMRDKRAVSEQYDIVHSHGLKPDLYVLRNKPTHGKTKFITTLHCYVFADFKDLYGTIKGYSLAWLYLLSKHRHDRLVTLSKDAMHYYGQYLPKQKLTYAYNTRDLDTAKGLTQEELQELTTFKGNGKLIGMNCVLIRRKGIDLMLEALALLPDDYKLFVVGEGPCKAEFMAMAEKLKLSARVCFAGQRSEAYRYLPHYDIYALPSRSEGFPLALLEAAVFATPTVCSNLPTVVETFSADEIAIFPLPDAEKLAKAVAMVTEHHGVRLKERFEKSYSPTSFYQQYFNIYNE